MLSVFLIIVSGVYIYEMKRAYEDAFLRLAQVQSGMTKEEVKAIMGEPQSIAVEVDGRRSYEVWIYGRMLGAAENPACYIDVESGLVSKVNRYNQDRSSQ